MLLKGQDLEHHIENIESLYYEFLSEVPKGVTYFGIIENSELIAVASLKCYSGHWYLRGCVVKPEYRGRGLQRELIRERLEFLSAKAKAVRVSVFPGNVHSIRNIEAEGFVYERDKKLSDGKIVQVYKKDI